MDRDAAVKWLAGGIGDPPVELPKKIQTILIAGYDAGHWTEADMPSTGTQAAASSKLWRAILTDSAAEANEQVTAGNAVRFDNWLLGRLESDVDDVTSSTYVPSQRELDDLKAQGMTGLREILHLELAGFLGRSSPESGIKGGTYGCTANEMDGAKLAFKQKRDTIETVIANCRAAGSLRLLDRFYGQLSTDLTRNEDPSIRNLSTRFLQFWQAANRNLMSNTEAVLMYVEEYRTDYRGRGMPVIYDSEIGGRAMWQGAVPSSLHSHSLGGFGAKGGGGTLDASSSGGSSISAFSSASHESSQRSFMEAQAAMQARQEAMASQIMELIKGVNSLTGTVASIKSGKDKEYYKDATCNICGQKGHIAKDCPDKDKGGKKKDGD